MGRGADEPKTTGLLFGARRQRLGLWDQREPSSRGRAEVERLIGQVMEDEVEELAQVLFADPLTGIDHCGNRRLLLNQLVAEAPSLGVKSADQLAGEVAKHLKEPGAELLTSLGKALLGRLQSISWCGDGVRQLVLEYHARGAKSPLGGQLINELGGPMIDHLLSRPDGGSLEEKALVEDLGTIMAGIEMRQWGSSVKQLALSGRHQGLGDILVAEIAKDPLSLKELQSALKARGFERDPVFFGRIRDALASWSEKQPTGHSASRSPEEAAYNLGARLGHQELAYLEDRRQALCLGFADLQMNDLAKPQVRECSKHYHRAASESLANAVLRAGTEQIVLWHLGRFNDVDIEPDYEDDEIDRLLKAEVFDRIAGQDVAECMHKAISFPTLHSPFTFELDTAAFNRHLLDAARRQHYAEVDNDWA